MALAVIRPETPSRLKATHISADVKWTSLPQQWELSFLKV